MQPLRRALATLTATLAATVIVTVIVTVITLPLATTPARAQAGAEAEAEALHLHGAFARVLGGVGAAGAVYLTLHNGSDHAVTLTGISSAVARGVALHASVESADGLMTMVQLDQGLTLSPDQSHRFVPGGDHIMLMGMTRALKDGDSFALTLSFIDAAPLTLDVIIDNHRAPDAAADPDGDATNP